MMLDPKKLAIDLTVKYRLGGALNLVRKVDELAAQANTLEQLRKTMGEVITILEFAEEQAMKDLVIEPYD